MSRAQDGLTFYFDQSDHAIPNRDFVVEMLLDIVPGIALSSIGTQVDHAGAEKVYILSDE